MKFLWENTRLSESNANRSTRGLSRDIREKFRDEVPLDSRVIRDFLHGFADARRPVSECRFQQEAHVSFVSSISAGRRMTTRICRDPETPSTDFQRATEGEQEQSQPARGGDYAALGVRRGGEARRTTRCEQCARLRAAVNYD